MNPIALSMIFIAAQLNALQDKPTCTLAPHKETISFECGGKILKLINAPPTISLPLVPPKPDGSGSQWSVDIKNLGPRPVTLIGKNGLNQKIEVNQLIHVLSNGMTYSVKR